ncbi:MAG: acyltransferase [Paludibacter sp.]
MQSTITIIFKIIGRFYHLNRIMINVLIARFLLYTNNVKFGKIFSNGIPYVSIALGGKCIINNNFRMNNNISGNPIGRTQRCIIFVDKGAKLTIGRNVGISSTAIVAHESIIIGDNVRIGGGVCIYDTDFHSLDANTRFNSNLDRKFSNKKPVLIEANAFIGAHSTILKGVTIGANSIVGACSVVTNSIPPNEIWAGNPAKFLRRIS